MASPDHYRNKLKTMGLDYMEIAASSVPEAKETLKHIRGMEKELRLIKRNINLDIKTIRTNYNHKMSSAASTTSSLASLFGKRKLAGKFRADEKRRLRMERDRTLEPYESIKLSIENLLIQMQSAKTQLQIFIEEARDEEQAKRQVQRTKKTVNKETQTYFCPKCGNAVGKSDKFCRKCGNRLR